MPAPGNREGPGERPAPAVALPTWHGVPARRLRKRRRPGRRGSRRNQWPLSRWLPRPASGARNQTLRATSDEFRLKVEYSATPPRASAKAAKRFNLAGSPSTVVQSPSERQPHHLNMRVTRWRKENAVHGYNPRRKRWQRVRGANPEVPNGPECATAARRKSCASCRSTRPWIRSATARWG